MSVLVTAATGHLGRLTVEHLLAAGHPADEIVATARDVSRLQPLAAKGVRVAVADYDQPATLAAAFADVEVALLVSGNELGRRVQQHANAIDAAVAAGVKRVVYTSAPHADTTTLVVAPEHKATEEHLLTSGVAWTLLRNGWYTENYLPVLEPARATGVLIGSAGDGRVASASREDYAAAAATVLLGSGHEEKTYELGGDHAWSYDELATAVGEVVGRSVRYERLSSEDHLAALIGVGVPEGQAQFLVALDANTRDGLLAETTGDLRNLIGRPTTPMLEGLRRAS
jgi:NAD(P)H dehydrogenase (quinone)